MARRAAPFSPIDELIEFSDSCSFARLVQNIVEYFGTLINKDEELWVRRKAASCWRRRVLDARAAGQDSDGQLRSRFRSRRHAGRATTREVDEKNVMFSLSLF